MIITLKVIIGFIGLILLFLSGRWLFDTQRMAKEHGIQPLSNTGNNYLKGDIGGILLGAGIFIGLFLFDGLHWMWPTVILLACVSGARMLSMITDGYSKQGAIAIAVELLLIALLYGVSILG